MKLQVKQEKARYKQVSVPFYLLFIYLISVVKIHDFMTYVLLMFMKVCMLSSFNFSLAC